MRTAAPPQIPVSSDLISAEVLEREGLAHEPLVMLEEVDGRPTVRKMTMPEKLAYADRTGGSVFADSEEELEEMFGLLDEQADRNSRS